MGHAPSVIDVRYEQVGVPWGLGHRPFAWCVLIAGRSQCVIETRVTVPSSGMGFFMSLIAITGAAAAGDRFLVSPFNDASSVFSTNFSSPKALAMANPVAASAGASNQGTLAMESLVARSVPAPAMRWSAAHHAR